MDHSKILRTIAFSTLAALLVINLCVAFFYIAYKPLDPDEFQHTHIAWNMLNGKILYKDFWEHHGPLFAFINYGLFKAFDLQPHFDTFYFLRGISFIYFSLILFFTYKISRVVFKERMTALISVAVLSSFYFFHLKGIEIRPDGLQNVFWFAGIYVVISQLSKFHWQHFAIAGMLLGLAVNTNAKAYLGLAILGAALCADYYLSKDKKKERFARMVYLIAGFLGVMALIVLYFASVGAVGDYVRSNYLFNIVEITRDVNPWMFPNMAHILITQQLPLVIGFFVGTALLWRELYVRFDRQKAFFLFVTLASASGALIGLFSQFYISFLPLVAILIAYAFTRISAWCKSSWQPFVFFGILALYFIPMEQVLFKEIQLMSSQPWNSTLAEMFADARTIIEQKEILEYSLFTTKRSESMGYFWNGCGSFTFNEDVQYYWSYSLLHGDTSRALVGYDTYGSVYVEALKEQNVQYINASENEINSLHSSDTRTYILQNYERLNTCLLKKRDVL